jgi:8-oxo-dGTP diphosphatase
MMELWDLYDKYRNKTGRIHERGKPIQKGDYHVVVHVWIMNSKNEILVTKRHPKKTYPGLWECPGGSVIKGESSLQGAIREVKEEIGIKLSEDNSKLEKSERRDYFSDFYDVWVFNQDFDVKDTIPQEGEVTEIKWVTKSELDHMFNNDNLVPTLNYYKSIFED